MTKQKELEFYLDYVNIFISVRGFAEHYSLDLSEANKIIDAGRHVNDSIYETLASSKRMIKKYGVYLCLEAFKANENGEGASSIGDSFKLTTNTADALINAGRDLDEQLSRPVQTETENAIYKLIDKMDAIFAEYGGYDHNDMMIYQLNGINESLNGCMNDADYDIVLEYAQTTMRWFAWVKKSRVMQENEPKTLFG
tara:strand:- start:31 stop:621 length:591 start_codon:yes stop_codon:yes gene_type:complete